MSTPRRLQRGSIVDTKRVDCDTPYLLLLPRVAGFEWMWYQNKRYVNALKLGPQWIPMHSVFDFSAISNQSADTDLQKYNTPLGDILRGTLVGLRLTEKPSCVYVILIGWLNYWPITGKYTLVRHVNNEDWLWGEVRWITLKLEIVKKVAGFFDKFENACLSRRRSCVAPRSRSKKLGGGWPAAEKTSSSGRSSVLSHMKRLGTLFVSSKSRFLVPLTGSSTRQPNTGSARRGRQPPHIH